MGRWLRLLGGSPSLFSLKSQFRPGRHSTLFSKLQLSVGLALVCSLVGIVPLKKAQLDPIISGILVRRAEITPWSAWLPRRVRLCCFGSFSKVLDGDSNLSLSELRLLRPRLRVLVGPSSGLSLGGLAPLGQRGTTPH